MSSTSPPKRFLHETVSEALEWRITGRHLLPGELLPGENALSEEFDVSRSVVRQALRTLHSRGLVQIVPGRGTVVTASTQWHRNAQRLEGLSAQMRALGVRVSTHVLLFERRKSSGRALAFGTPGCFVLERMRRVDGEPVAFIRTFLPLDVGEKIRVDELENVSLHNAMRERAGTDLRGGERQVRAIAATGGIATHLALDAGAPVLLLEGSSVDRGGRTVEVFSTWHRSDKIALDLTAYASAAPETVPVEELKEIAGQARALVARLDRFA